MGHVANDGEDDETSKYRSDTVHDGDQNGITVEGRRNIAHLTWDLCITLYDAMLIKSDVRRSLFFREFEINFWYQ